MLSADKQGRVVRALPDRLSAVHKSYSQDTMSSANGTAVGIQTNSFYGIPCLTMSTSMRPSVAAAPLHSDFSWTRSEGWLSKMEQQYPRYNPHFLSRPQTNKWSTSRYLYPFSGLQQMGRLNGESGQSDLVDASDQPLDLSRKDEKHKNIPDLQQDAYRPHQLIQHWTWLLSLGLGLPGNRPNNASNSTAISCRLGSSLEYPSVEGYEKKGTIDVIDTAVTFSTAQLQQHSRPKPTNRGQSGEPMCAPGRYEHGQRAASQHHVKLTSISRMFETNGSTANMTNTGMNHESVHVTANSKAARTLTTTLSTSTRRPYTEAELAAAVRAICFGRLGTRRAASVYGIPRSTLRNKICKLNELKRREEERLGGQTIVLSDFLRSSLHQVQYLNTNPPASTGSSKTTTLTCNTVCNNLKGRPIPSPTPSTSIRGRPLFSPCASTACLSSPCTCSTNQKLIQPLPSEDRNASTWTVDPEQGQTSTTELPPQNHQLFWLQEAHKEDNCVPIPFSKPVSSMNTISRVASIFQVNCRRSYASRKLVEGSSLPGRQLTRTRKATRFYTPRRLFDRHQISRLLRQTVEASDQNEGDMAFNEADLRPPGHPTMIPNQPNDHELPSFQSTSQAGSAFQPVAPGQETKFL